MKCPPEKMMEVLITVAVCDRYKSCSFYEWAEYEDTERSWTSYFEDETCKSCRYNLELNK